MNRFVKFKIDTKAGYVIARGVEIMQDKHITGLLLIGAAFCSTISLQIANADPVTTNICIGDVGPGKCFPPEASFDCAFARANPANTDKAAAELFCAKRGGANVINATRIDVHGGGACGYIVVSVTCSQ